MKKHSHVEQEMYNVKLTMYNEQGTKKVPPPGSTYYFGPLDLPLDCPGGDLVCPGFVVLGLCGLLGFLYQPLCLPLLGVPFLKIPIVHELAPIKRPADNTNAATVLNNFIFLSFYVQLFLHNSISSHSNITTPGQRSSIQLCACVERDRLHCH